MFLSPKDKVLFEKLKAENKTSLIILCLLSEKEAHGYELKKRIIQCDLLEWANIKISSIYPTLNKLVSMGAIVGHQEKRGNNPECKVFKITKNGKKMLQKAFKEHFKTGSKPSIPKFLIGSHFLGCFKNKESISMLADLNKDMAEYKEKLIMKIEKLKNETDYFHLLPIEIEIEIMDVLLRKTNEIMKNMNQYIHKA
ncbi:MAG: PadR family transcriptional regulator [Candidatus Coatesbacteria bacterium]|nr:PadR family transcriptional regulator [Candidatus Coatesbacteria bacterium]